MPHTVRVTAACFLAYFTMSAMLAPIGILTTPMAAHYGVSVTEATSWFSALTLGILVGASGALAIPATMNFRRLFVGLYLVLAAALATLALQPAPVLLQAALAVVGAGCGVGLAAAAVNIARLYNGNQRASLLVATDGCFSIAGSVTPWLATTLLAASAPWGGVYAAIAAVAALIVALAGCSRFPQPDTGIGPVAVASERWPLTAWLGIVALTCYTLGQYAILFWLPNYLDSTYGYPVTDGGALVGRFWTGMFVAQIAVSIIVLRLGTRVLLSVASVATMVGSIPLWQVADLGQLRWLAMAWGIANLGLLKLALSFVTEQFKTPTPRLVSCVLLGATAGTAISPSVTSHIVAMAGPAAALQFGTGCHVLMCVLLVLALLRSRS
ncbi:MAG: MFS transporter TsgA [Pseudomonadota bacterium]